MSAVPAIFGRSIVARSGRFGLLFVLGFGLCSLPIFLGVLNHDEAWYLLVARRVLDGQRLYVDVFDTNPPLIIWLNLLPVALAGALGISEILALRIMVLGMVGASLGLTRWSLVQSLPGRVEAQRALLSLGLFILLPVVGYDFAQREHLMMILVLPYLVLATARATGRQPGGPIPWLVGVLAGLGLAIKPQFALLWLSVEGTLVVRRGWRAAIRPEGLAIVTIGLVYAVALLTITPDYLLWIRRITSVYYGAGGAPIGILASEFGSIFTALAVLGLLMARPTGDARRRLELIGTANVALLAIAILQLKGYSYQFYPPLALALMTMGWLVVDRPSLESGRAPRVVGVIGAVLLVVVSLIAILRGLESIAWRGNPGATDTPYGRLIRASREHATGESVFVFSPAVATGFPMVNYAGVGWASRHPALLFLPGCYPAGPGSGSGPDVALHAPNRMSASERFLFDDVIDKLLTDQPTLLFVDEAGTPLAYDGRRFDYLAYYAQDPRFARFLSDYEPLNRIDQFRLYRRKTGAAR